MKQLSTTGRYALRVLAAVLFTVGGLSLTAASAGADHTGTDGPEVTPEFIAHSEDNNPTCAKYAGANQEWLEVKHDAPPANTSVTSDDGKVTIEISHAESAKFSWQLTSAPAEVGGIDAVVVKAGTEGHNLYRYDPTVGEVDEDDGLTSPTGQGISHISFCYDVEQQGATTTTEQETTTTEQETTTTEQETTTTTEQETTTTTEQATTTTTEQATTTTTEQETTTTTEQQPTTTTEQAPTTTAEVQSGVTERQTEVGGVQVTQAPARAAAAPAPAPAVESAQVARTGSDSNLLITAGVFLIAMGVGALRLSRRPAAAQIIAR